MKPKYFFKGLQLVFPGLLMLTFGQQAFSQEHASLNYLFQGGREGYECFRIPALVTTPEGTLLAFAEGRKNGCSDTGDIDLVMKRSVDGGKSWSPLTVIRDDGENVCGNPAPVVEAGSGTIFLLSTWNLGEDREREIINETSEDTRRVFVMRSEDDGRSWSDPREITRDVKKEEWTWYATGPCHGIQLKHSPFKGRLVIPCDHIEAGTKKYYSHIIYSDDLGETWKLGGTTPQDQVNECTVAELGDGRLMLNMRNYDRSQKNRKISWSDNGGITWSNLVSDTTLIEPICQASLLSAITPEGKPVLCFSNPSHPDKREQMTLRISTDKGSTWSVSQLLHAGPAAYSDLTQLPDGTIGCLYEAGKDNPYEGIVFHIISLKVLE